MTMATDPAGTANSHCVRRTWRTGRFGFRVFAFGEGAQLRPHVAASQYGGVGDHHVILAVDQRPGLPEDSRALSMSCSDISLVRWPSASFCPRIRRSRRRARARRRCRRG